MSKTNVIEKVKSQIREMQETKEKELEIVKTKEAEAYELKAAAEAALKDATSYMNLEAYEAARENRKKAQIALDMYSAKYKQIAQKEYISEEESDKVVDSLLSYEDDLAENFKAAIAEPLKILNELQEKYFNEIKATEQTIVEWTRKIHPNYRSFGTTFADGTNRSKEPVAVRRLPFEGCKEANQLKNYLKKAQELF